MFHNDLREIEISRMRLKTSFQSYTVFLIAVCLSGLLAQIDETSTCAVVCRNGPTEGACAQDCDCDVDGEQYFWGEFCEFINLNATTHTTSARTVEFFWNSPPRLSGPYSYLYKHDNDDESPVVWTKPVEMEIDDTSDLLYRLDSGEVPYIICIIDSDLAETIRVNQTLALLRVSSAYDDCIRAVTQLSIMYEYSLAAYVITAYIGVVFLSLVILKMVKSAKTPLNMEKG